jgi:hypothetical protein
MSGVDVPLASVRLIRKYLDAQPDTRRMVNVTAFAFKCPCCDDIFLDGFGASRDDNETTHCDQCSFQCEQCHEWSFMAAPEDDPLSCECERCGVAKCDSCMDGDICFDCKGEENESSEEEENESSEEQQTQHPNA